MPSTHRRCDQCGAVYDYRRRTSQFCRDQCRKRHRRASEQASEVTPLPGPFTRRELVAAGRLESAMGQLALILATHIDSTTTATVRSLAPLRKAHRESGRSVEDVPAVSADDPLRASGRAGTRSACKPEPIGPNEGEGKGPLALGAVTYWQALTIALIPTIGVLLGVWFSTKDLAVRRQLDGTDKFFAIVMVANGRPENRGGVGTAEQVAAVELLAEFGITEKHLRAPALAALNELENSMPDGVVTKAARNAAARLK